MGLVNPVFLDAVGHRHASYCTDVATALSFWGTWIIDSLVDNFRALKLAIATIMIEIVNRYTGYTKAH